MATDLVAGKILICGWLVSHPPPIFSISPLEFHTLITSATPRHQTSIFFKLFLHTSLYKLLCQSTHYGTHFSLNFSGVISPTPDPTFGTVMNSNQPSYDLPTTPRDRYTILTCKVLLYHDIFCLTLLSTFFTLPLKTGFSVEISAATFLHKLHTAFTTLATP